LSSYAFHAGNGNTPYTAPVSRDTGFTVHSYDAEGRTLSTIATGTRELPNPENGVVRVIETYVYDAAGRVRTHARNTSVDSTFYDEASNVVRTATKGGGGFTQTFDVLNRVQTRIVAAKTYARNDCGGFMAGAITDPNNALNCLVVFPAFPNGANISYVTPLDTAAFTYDAYGRMTVAANVDAIVRRGYHRNGAIRADTTTYRNVTTSGFGNQRAIRYHYDLSGRRDTLTLPSASTIQYTYRSDDGALLTVTDPNATSYRYVYDLQGRVDSIVIGANAIREKRWYDADGRQYARQRVRPQGTLTNETLTFDAQGRVVKAAYYSATAAITTDTTYVTYSGLGAVLARERLQLVGSWRWETEEFRVDGVGNVRRSRTGNWDQTETMPDTAVYDKRGELTVRESPANPQYPYEYSRLQQSFDLDGQLLSSHKYAKDKNNQVISDNPTRYYYGADKKLRAVQRHDVAGGGGRGTWEEYRYDALGRRVLIVARPGVSPTPGCTAAGKTYCVTMCTVGDCESKVTRFVWDGDRILREEREPYPGGPYTAPYYGIVDYVHGLELDHPLGTLDGQVNGTRIPNANWRGVFESSVSPSGTSLDCAIPLESCTVRVAWASSQAVYQRPKVHDNQGGEIPIAFAGSLMSDQQDGTGQMYRRNRYYDPQSGRFTQEDPIGLAGGVNLYGFASGDPINFSDPFGLEKITEEERKKLGNQCEKVNCDKADIHRGNDGKARNLFRKAVLFVSGGRSVTLGNHVYLANEDAQSIPVLAHEVTHVGQYQQWGAMKYYGRGAGARFNEAFGSDPYSLP